MIPCPIKTVIGYTCPGCGIQRSIFSLLELDLKNSFNFYPPLVLGIFIAFLFLILKQIFKNLNSNQLIYLNLIIVFINYFSQLI